MIVDTEDEAVELANDSEFGLTASVWGKNLARAEGIARDLNVGTVLLNDCLFSHAAPQLPWGGLKKAALAEVIRNLGCKTYATSSTSTSTHHQARSESGGIRMVSHA